MAWLEERSGLFRIAFRFGGKKHQHSLKTNDREEAEGCLLRLKENLRLVERGRLEVPKGADLGLFLVSDGKLNGKPKVERAVTLEEVFELYSTELPEGVKEPSTRYTEKIHLKHLKRLIGGRVPFEVISKETLQRYVNDRSKETGRHGKPVSRVTIQKEIGTLGSVWNKWARNAGLVHIPAPTQGLIYQKAKGKPPFQTWGQIERKVSRGSLADSEKQELWDSLFLTLPQVDELLLYVRENARSPFVYPMFVLAAHTGARRSEILRSLVDDFDFTANTVTLREKKKDHSREITFRSVPMSPLLRSVMHDWLKRHPGGGLTICGKPNVALTPQLAAHHFRWTVDGSKWEVLRGWHVLRHSFASNCAGKGIDQRLIDSWMGHQTEEMRRRYRHLIPALEDQAIRLVFAETE